MLRPTWETGRHELAVWILTWAAITGMTQLTGVAERPRSISDTLPGWVQIAWYVLLLAAGVTGLAGAWLQGRMPEAGLYLEGGSMSFLAGGAAVYSAAIFITAGWAGFAAGSLIASLGLASLFRIRRIWRDTHPGA